MKSYLKKLFWLVPLIILITSFKNYSLKETDSFNLKELEKSLVLINCDSVFIGNPLAGNGAYPYTYPNSRKWEKIYLPEFLMSKYEVTNKLYLEFVNDFSKNNKQLLATILPDTLVWRSRISYNEPYVQYYLRHPAYANFPVVGVSHKQAELFCDWLTKKYATYEKRKYKNIEFKLPSEKQWVVAAKGGNSYRELPLNNILLWNNKGEKLANFRSVSQFARPDTLYQKLPDGNLKEKIVYTTWPAGFMEQENINTNADVTAPVNSYYPNNYGLYNMGGNVEEFIRENGITKGGSWRDTGYYLLNYVYETYDSINETSSARGFRFIAEFDK